MYDRAELLCWRVSISFILKRNIKTSSCLPLKFLGHEKLNFAKAFIQ